MRRKEPVIPAGDRLHQRVGPAQLLQALAPTNGLHKRNDEIHHKDNDDEQEDLELAVLHSISPPFPHTRADEDKKGQPEEHRSDREGAPIAPQPILLPFGQGTGNLGNGIEVDRIARLEAVDLVDRREFVGRGERHEVGERADLIHDLPAADDTEGEGNLRVRTGTLVIGHGCSSRELRRGCGIAATVS